ncbi:MAG: hypothetical protein ACRDYE_00115 [Acidimicrobiales bacterium]
MALTASACGGATSASGHAGPTGGEPPGNSSSNPTHQTVPPPARDTNANHRMFAFYYLWWDTQHWHARLGPNYPYSANPLPLPATLSGNGCTVANNFEGNQLTDVASPLWTQDDPSQIRADVALAAQTGLAGFAVSWAGTGLPHQTASSSAFNRRLATLVSAVHQINQAGTPFSLWIAYISSARIRTQTQIDNDFSYLQTTYGNDPAFDRSNSSRPTLIMMGSRKYPQSVLDQVSARWRPHFFLVGDENWDTWDSAKAADFDADQYYWSSQNPLTNQGSFRDIDRLAAEVRSTRNPDGSAKQFFSPLAPGYNKVLGGGSGCVPRNGGQTMKDIFAGNSSANPDGWTVISWNEIDEGTYVVPLERYGQQSLITLSSIIHGPPSGGGA